MIRIKYKKVNDYLVSVKNFSTNVHKDLVYAVINKKTFRYGFVNASIPRCVGGSSDYEPFLNLFGSSLTSSKKLVKKDLIYFGVNFDVEARNKTK